MARFFLMASAVSGFFAVALGAFGAHGLKKVLEEKYLAVFHTGVEYQFYHAFALGLVGLLCLKGDAPYLKASGYSFLVGIVLFSGSLYALALTRIGILGAITPFGGVGFLVGWFLLFLAARTF